MNLTGAAASGHETINGMLAGPPGLGPKRTVAIRTRGKIAYAVAARVVLVIDLKPPQLPTLALDKIHITGCFAT